MPSKVDVISRTIVKRWVAGWLGGVALGGALLAPASAAAWEPSKTVEFIVPAGTGGGADQMARFLQGIVAKHSLMKQPLVVINKPGGAGAEGFLDMKASSGNPHKVVMTLSNVFTTPLATGIPFSYRDLTPVAMLALDQFVLWVNAAAPYKTAQEYLEAIRSAPDNKFTMGGTGSKQEDQLITVALGKALNKKLTYVPFKGGGDVATQLVGAHISSTVNNPVEAVGHWRSGKLRALCVFRGERMPQTKKVTAELAWSDIPTCKEAGIDVSYQMLRGVFLPAGASAEQVAFYVDLFQRVRALPEWKDFIETGAFQDTNMSGASYAEWLQNTDGQHRALMQEAGFLAP